MKAAAFIAIILSVVVSVVASSGAGAQLFQFVQLLPGRDLTGHFVLYGFLGFTVAGWLGHTPKTARDTGWTAALMALLIIAEEGSQTLFAARTFSLSDLLASLAGLLLGVFLARLIPRSSADKR